MSLADAVKEIADQIETDAKQFLAGGTVPAKDCKNMMISHVRMLRMAVRAAEGTAPPPSPMTVSAEAQHAIEIQKARNEFRKARHGEGAEEHAPRMVEVAGAANGDANGVPVHVAIDSTMPVGAKTLLGTTVYQLLADGKLHPVGEAEPGQQGPAGILLG